jgi:hypothetical protein
MSGESQAGLHVKNVCRCYIIECNVISFNPGGRGRLLGALTAVQIFET